MVTTQSEAGKLGWIASIAYRETKYKQIREKYESNPKICEYCNKKIPWEHRRNKHCSISCSAKTRVRKRKRVKIVHNTCPRCGKPTGYNKWCSKKCQSIIEFTEKIESGTPIGKKAVRKYLLLTREHMCEQCKTMEWVNEHNEKVPITLEAHHIDGDHNNNKDSNLKLLCPNCHSITDNYKSKNNGHGRDNRRKSATGAVMALRSACNRDIVGSIPISGFRHSTVNPDNDQVERGVPGVILPVIR